MFRMQPCLQKAVAIVQRALDKEIRSQLVTQHSVKEKFGEVYRFVSDLVYRSPTVLIIIDEKIKDLDDVIASIPAETKILEFRTFEKEGVGLAVRAHLFEPPRF